MIRVDGPTRRSVLFESLGELVVKSSLYRARVGNGSNSTTTLTSYAVIGLWSVAIVFGLVSAAALGGKPVFDPATSMDEVHVYELTSEVHFHYWVSGAALIATTLLVAADRVRGWLASRAR